MKITRTYTIQRLLPAAGLSIGGLAIGTYAFAISSQTIRLNHSAQTSTQSQAGSIETPNVTLNGKPIQLDSNGKASVITPEGATVTVQTDRSSPSTSSATTSGIGSQISTDSIQIVSGSTGGGEGQNRSSSSSRVQVFDNSSTSSSSYSRTFSSSNGEGDITVSN